MNLNMLLPATPWDIPANFPLWARRVSEHGLSAQDKVAQGAAPGSFDLAKTVGDVATYAFGYGQSAKTLSSASKTFDAPIFGGGASAAAAGGGGEITMDQLMNPGQPAPSIQQDLSGASQQVQESLSIK